MTGTTYLEKASGCKVDGCYGLHSAKGYCRSHYQTAKRGIEPMMNRLCLYCGKPVTDRTRQAELHRECIPLHTKNYIFARTYGITLQEYEALSTYQKNQCAICKNLSENLHVDHDHISGNVRGLLCGICNRALGGFRDDPEILINARDYLVMPPNYMYKMKTTQHTLEPHEGERNE